MAHMKLDVELLGLQPEGEINAHGYRTENPVKDGRAVSTLLESAEDILESHRSAPGTRRRVEQQQPDVHRGVAGLLRKEK